jgi:hypothetical protein
MSQGKKSPAIMTAQDVALSHGYRVVIEPAQKFRAEQLQEILEMWRRKSAGRSMPKRTDIAMRDIARWVRNIAFVEILVCKNPFRYRYMPRFMGDAIVEVRSDLAGKFIDEDSSRSYREVISALYDEARLLKIPLRYYGPVPHERYSFRRSETIIAPLSEDGIVPNMLVVANYTMDANATESKMKGSQRV